MQTFMNILIYSTKFKIIIVTDVITKRRFSFIIISAYNNLQTGIIMI